MDEAKDKNRLLKHFQKDPVLFAYHIGDLDDFFFPLCRWPVLTDDLGIIKEALLVYNNPRFVTAMAFGLTDDFGSFLQREINSLPERFYGHFQKTHRHIFLSRYDERVLGTHYKMQLQDFRKSHDDDDANIRRLDMSHLDQVEIFYAEAYPDGYFDPRQLKMQKTFGYFQDDLLCSVAGLHVYSDAYKIAVLGGIATLPQYRGRGLARRVTSRLTEELFLENKLISLNVKADNQAAITCYQRLGFAVSHEYEEALFTRR